jgi:hypothetical protein
MKFYRVKQVSENQFIPQVKSFIIDNWKGIDDDMITWYSKDFQKEWCAKNTLDEAKEVIIGYKNRNLEKKQYPKYYKI